MHVCLAQPSDGAIVAGILSAAADKLRSRGEELWAATEVSELAMAPHIRDGLYHLGFDADQAFGVFRYQLADRAFWPEIPRAPPLICTSWQSFLCDSALALPTGYCAMPSL